MSTGLDVDYSERAGFLTGKAAALAEWRHKKDKREFERMCGRLRARNWIRKIYAEGVGCARHEANVALNALAKRGELQKRGLRRTAEWRRAYEPAMAGAA